MAMEAVWMTRAVHMKGSILRIITTTSGLFVKSAGANSTINPAQEQCKTTPLETHLKHEDKQEGEIRKASEGQGGGAQMALPCSKDACSCRGGRLRPGMVGLLTLQEYGLTRHVLTSGSN